MNNNNFAQPNGINSTNEELTSEEKVQFNEMGGVDAYLEYTPDREDYNKYRELYLKVKKPEMSKEYPLMTVDEVKQYWKLRGYMSPLDPIAMSEDERKLYNLLRAIFLIQ